MLMDTFSNLQVLELRNNQFISLKVSSDFIDVGDRFQQFLSPKTIGYGSWPIALFQEFRLGTRATKITEKTLFGSK